VAAEPPSGLRAGRPAGTGLPSPAREPAPLEPTRPSITVVFLLFNAASTVRALVAAMRAQRHPLHPRQSDWTRVMFVDDASRDGTLDVLRLALAEASSPAHWEIVANDVNLGLAGTLNRVLRTVQTPFVLTCHCDCFFGLDDYVAMALTLLENRPRAAAITGRPALDPGARLPFAEKLNLITNMMDVLPAAPLAEVVPVGFAEGRCDAFRLSALAEVGYYDAVLRTSGEDQLLAADLRSKGYEVLQAPGLPYFLRLSEEQNSLGKLVRHQHLFGRTHPFILFRRRGAFHGIVSPQAGPNRRARALLRLSQILAVPLYLATAVALTLRLPAWTWATPVLVVLLARTLLFFRHIRAVRPAWYELLGVYAVQPVLDFSYAAGFVQGLTRLTKSGREPIR
jgi:GT2 family glycosyltransferase